MEGERIAKVMARSGLCSRRDAERWIAENRVKVNGKLLTTPAFTVTDQDKIIVDGKPLPRVEETRLWLYHKPKGLITSHKDPQGRPTVFENLPASLPRVISVGRLDFNSEGLLLLTNDGALARYLELPSQALVRQYRVRVFGQLNYPALESLKNGITVDNIKYGPIHVEFENEGTSNAWLIISITEGKNREIRKVLDHLGLTVNRLIRLAYGPFQLGKLERGGIKEVSAKIIKEQIGKFT